MASKALSECGTLRDLEEAADSMKYLKIRNVDDETYARVRLIAKAKGWSLSCTAKFLLTMWFWESKIKPLV